MKNYAHTVGGLMVPLRLDPLLDSRMLIQANSGGGKSYAVRKLLEITHGHVQHIVVDPEGEFATLRENFDYVICAAQGGDALAHPKTAKILAERLLETRVSAICDIYELKHHERHAFVRIFLDTMVNAPKSLWHPVLVVLDEAHVFAPETDKSEAHGAVADIATRGRKRGFCLVAATQRISKLSKDVAAELNNKLIGRATLDVDVKRAAAELGMSNKDAMEKLRLLPAGHFYAFGPALPQIPTEVKVDAVETRHPKRGDRHASAPPKPTAAILAVLPKLADLAQEAATELRTIEDLKRELANVRRDFTALKNAAVRSLEDGKARVKLAPSKEDLKAEFDRGFSAGAIDGRKKTMEQIAKHVSAIKGNAIDYAKKWETEVFESILTLGRMTPLPEAPKQIKREGQIPVPPIAHKQIGVKPYDSDPPRRREGSAITSAPQQRILDAIAWFKDKGIDRPVKQAIGAVAGASPKSSAFSNNLGALRSAGLIDYDGKGGVFLTLAGEAESVAPRDSRTLIECWKSIVTGPQAKILEVLREDHPSQVAKPGLAERSGASVSSSAFSNNLGALRTLGAIDYPASGFVALTKHAI